MSENVTAEQTTDEQTTEALFHELSTELAASEAQYSKDKKTAKDAKDKRDQAVAKRYWDSVDEPNLDELAELFGKSVAFATATAKEAGIELSTGKRGRPSKFSEAEQKAIAQEFADAKESFKVYELAATHKVAPETIKGWAVKFGMVTVKSRKKQDA